MAINDVLKILRENKGLSMAKTAESLEIPKGTYASYEYGQREPNIEMINKIATFYNVTTDYLLGREPEKNPIAMLNLTIREKEALEMYIKLPKEVRQVIIDTMIQLGDAAKNAEHKAPKIDVTYSKIYADEGGVSKKETQAGLPKISDFFDD